VREIVKLAVRQAQKRSRLSEYTTFSRITTSRGDLDHFSGEFAYPSIFFLSLLPLKIQYKHVLLMMKPTG
jgi:hypothetical protein